MSLYYTSLNKRDFGPSALRWAGMRDAFGVFKPSRPGQGEEKKVKLMKRVKLQNNHGVVEFTNPY